MKKLLLLLLFPFISYGDCWQHAALLFNIEAELLYAIAEQESSLKPNVIGHNKNGSKDFGLMQINSSHLPRLKKIGVTEKQLTENPCTSVVIGASILSDMMKIYGYSWEAVGAYNAGLSKKNKDARMNYAKKIWKRYNRIKKENIIKNVDG
ncbi:TPA: type III secretion system invasion protein IagB [Providencia rettgeri]